MTPAPESTDGSRVGPPAGRADVSLPAGGERVSLLCGDRPCARCGFNLTGQHVIREPHYAMLVVICPECGTPAALQEYPLLGRWAARWGALLAAVWVLFILALLAATVGASCGFAVLSTEMAGERFGKYIAELHLEWLKQDPSVRTPAPDPTTTASQANFIAQGAHPYSRIDSNWWAAQDLSLLLQKSGGWWAMFDWGIVYAWLGAFLPLTAAGIVWSIALSHVRRRRLWIVIPVVYAIVVAILAVVWSAEGPRSSRAWSWNTGRDLAGEVYFVPAIAMTIGAEMIAVFVGLMVGRPLARGLVRMFLPPKRRAPMSFLWTCDGKEPPRPRA